MEVAASPATMQQKFGDSQSLPLVSFAGYNVLLLAVVLFTEFSAYDLLVVIYLELAVIGLFAWLRLFAAALFGNPFGNHLFDVGRGATLFWGTLLGGFFIAKFGGLMLALGALILALPTEDIGIDWADASDLHPLVELCGYMLLARYAVMFVWSTIIRGDYKDTSALRLVFTPYLNGLWVFVTIGLGLFFAWRYPASPEFQFTLGVFAAKLLLDLVSLLLELRRTRLADVIAARRKRREALSRRFWRGFFRLIAASAVLAIAGVLVFGAYMLHGQIELEEALEADGVVVQGTIQAKNKSEGSSNSSPSYDIEVSYTWNGRDYQHPYWVRRSRWEALNTGEPIDITVLPDAPHRSQLTEYVGTSINGRGFIPIED